MKTNNAGYIIGAYPCAPSFHQRSEEEEKDFWRQLSETPDILGLEQPCLENFHPLGDQWLLRHTPESWKFVVTAVMETCLLYTSVILVHCEQVVVITLPFGRVALQLVNHRCGSHFLIRFTQLCTRFTERRVSRVRIEVSDIGAHRFFDRTKL